MTAEIEIETRCKKVIVRVTKTEQRAWREQARREGKRFSTFLRDLANKASGPANE